MPPKIRETQSRQPRTATTRPRIPRASMGASRNHIQDEFGRAVANLANASTPPIVSIDRMSRAGRFQLATLYGPQKHTVWTMRQVGQALMSAMRFNARAERCARCGYSCTSFCMIERTHVPAVQCQNQTPQCYGGNIHRRQSLEWHCSTGPRNGRERHWKCEPVNGVPDVQDYKPCPCTHCS